MVWNLLLFFFFVHFRRCTHTKEKRTSVPEMGRTGWANNGMLPHNIPAVHCWWMYCQNAHLSAVEQCTIRLVYPAIVSGFPAAIWEHHIRNTGVVPWKPFLVPSYQPRLCAVCKCFIRGERYCYILSDYERELLVIDHRIQKRLILFYWSGRVILLRYLQLRLSS